MPIVRTRYWLYEIASNFKEKSETVGLLFACSEFVFEKGIKRVVALGAGFIARPIAGWLIAIGWAGSSLRFKS